MEFVKTDIVRTHIFTLNHQSVRVHEGKPALLKDNIIKITVILVALLNILTCKASRIDSIF